MSRIIFFMLILTTGICNAQKNDAVFIGHLSNKGFHKEVIHLTKSIDFSSSTLALKDSLLYLRGWSYYNLKILNKSYEDLIKVTASSPFYYKSHFFAAYNQTYIGNYTLAKENVRDIKGIEPIHISLEHFSLAAISLLERDFTTFKEQIQQVDTTFFAFHVESEKFRQYAVDLKAHKRKSPVLAGIMSAVIPGSGKIYAGKTAQGISSFIAVAGLGFVTFENHRKLGSKNIKTIIFGTAFTFFYLSNIYGAVFSIKVSEVEFQDEFQNKILFNLHIPFRTIFN
ncbi:MAG: hypothetical protein K8R68_12320 [Bacteroidales bacterium]|nr:hypothetical protein [Bacteroidales bacterium]